MSNALPEPDRSHPTRTAILLLFPIGHVPFFSGLLGLDPCASAFPRSGVRSHRTLSALQSRSLRPLNHLCSPSRPARRTGRNSGGAQSRDSTVPCQRVSAACHIVHAVCHVPDQQNSNCCETLYKYHICCRQKVQLRVTDFSHRSIKSSAISSVLSNIFNLASQNRIMWC